MDSLLRPTLRMVSSVRRPPGNPRSSRLRGERQKCEIIVPLAEIEVSARLQRFGHTRRGDLHIIKTDCRTAIDRQRLAIFIHGAAAQIRAVR